MWVDLDLLYTKSFIVSTQDSKLKNRPLVEIKICFLFINITPSRQVLSDGDNNVGLKVASISPNFPLCLALEDVSVSSLFHLPPYTYDSSPRHFLTVWVDRQQSQMLCDRRKF